MSQPQLHSQKRNMTDFFKPTAKWASAKRPSTSPTPESPPGHDRSPKKQKKAPETPATSRRFVDIGSSPLKSPFASGLSPKLPIRSPQPKDHDTPSSLKPNLFFSPLRRQQSPAKDPAPPSFSSIATSGQSIVKDGKVIAVRDSDEDDSESLESLEDIFGRRKEDNTSSSSPPEDETKKESNRPSILNVFSNRERQAIVGKERLRNILAKERLHKFDISRLIDDHLDDAETKEKLDQANAYYEASAREAELDTGRSADDQKLLRDIVDGKGGDQGEVVKVLSAMERTGALASEQTFSFFAREGLTDWEDEAPPKHKCPKRDLPQDLWSPTDTEGRDRAYLCGQVGELAADGQLPDSLLKWTFESIALERSDDLRQAYVQCLTDAKKRWTRTNMTAQDVQNVFETLGACTDAIRDNVSIVLDRKPASSARQHDPKYLLSILEVFDAVAEELDFETLSKLSSILTRLSLDDEAMSDGHISTAVEELLARLLDLPNLQSRHHVAERILMDMYKNLKDSLLQARVLRHIIPTTPLAARLRQVLALSFILPESIPSLDLAKPPAISLPTLLQYLRSPTFDLSHRPDGNPVDYAELAALTHILDTAISDGGLPSIFSSAAEEQAFNRQVDDLADRVNVVYSSIADTGASHMRRTEAKEALGVLQKRLLYGVRTKARPKKSVFGRRDGKEYRSEERSKGAMQSYLMKREKTTTKGTSDVLQERHVNATSSSQQSESEKLIRRQLRLSQ